MRSPRVLAVDTGAGHVACGVFGVTGGKLILQRFALEAHNPDPGLEAQWSEHTALALGAISAREKLGGPAALSVPGHLALTKFVKTPAVEKSKRGKILNFEASQNIPYPLNEVVWDSLVVSDDSFDLEVMITAVKFETMEGLCAAADSAGFPISRATPSCLALARAFRYNYPEVAESLILVNIGARSTHLVFVEGPRFFVRTLALAGNAVTQSIAEELRLDFTQAEALKVQVLSGHSDLPVVSPSRAAVHKAVEVFATRLNLEITRSTVNHRRQTGAAQPVCVYLTGGGSLIAELPAALAEKLKLRVERYDPLRKVELGAAAKAAGAAASAHVLADLVGLATCLVSPDEPDASLLPPAIGQAIAFRKRQPWLLAAAALAVAALLPPIYYYNQLALVTQQKADEVDLQAVPLRSLQNRIAGNLAKIEEAKQQIGAIQSLVETKSNWINFFTDLQDRLVKVEDVWLEKLSVVRAPDSATADPAAPPAADGSAPAAPVAPKLHLLLSGRLLDAKNPDSKVSRDSSKRVNDLLNSFTGSQFVAKVENERFDDRQPGILRFDFTLVVNPKKPL